MLRAVGQLMLAVVLIYSARLYAVQEVLFWVAIAAVLCAVGTVAVAVVWYIGQIVRRGFRRIQARTQSISWTSKARIATGNLLNHILPR